MAVRPQHLVLRQPEPVNGAHQHATLAGEVADDFLLECRFKKVSRADGVATGQTALPGPAGGILMNGETGVDSLTLEEMPAHRGPRSLRRDEDYVNVLWRDYAGLIAEDDAETV